MDFFTFLTICVVFGCVTRITTAKIKARERSGFSEKDVRRSQETFKGLAGLEQRIEALETLLIERERDRQADSLAEQIERL